MQLVQKSEKKPVVVDCRTMNARELKALARLIIKLSKQLSTDRIMVIRKV